MGRSNFTDGLRRDALVRMTGRGNPVGDVSHRPRVSKPSLCA